MSERGTFERERTTKTLVKMPEVRAPDLRGLQSMGKVRQLVRGLDDSNLQKQSDATEALELTTQLARQLKIASNSVRPCISKLWFEGVSTQGNPYAHLLAVEFRLNLGFEEERVRELISTWNYERVEKRMPQREINKIVDNAFKPGQTDIYGCMNILMQGICIGQGCPWNNPANKAKKVSVDDFVRKGWLKVLTPGQTVIYETILRIFVLKGRPQNLIVYFCYNEFERHCNITRAHLTKSFTKLQEFGLLSTVSIANKKGTPTRVQLSIPIPYPSKHNTLS